MGETTDQIEHHIEMKRQELQSNFTELAQKAKAAMDWRRQFRKHTVTLIAAAFAAGVLLAAMLARTSWGGAPPAWARHARPSRQR
jgi:adenine/guanine phosphoribosyltransferase-like PRPP-binding protein